MLQGLFWLLANQVARNGFIVFFNDVFDALCRLSADSDPNVQVQPATSMANDTE